MSSRKAPIAIFDTAEHLSDQLPTETLTTDQKKDFQIAKNFLESYTGSDGTFRSYRREVERLLQWAWNISDKTLNQLKRTDLEAFIKFCRNPPKSWMGFENCPRFLNHQGIRIPNKQWKPFVVTISKSARKNGEEPNKNDYTLSDSAVKAIFQNLGSFFQFAVLEEHLISNPIMLLRQKSKFLKKQQGSRKIRRLSELQWQAVLEHTQLLAEENPKQHERTLFMLTALYSMYLRISELVASERWTPTMNDFHKDSENRWWFTTVGKGNKERNIAVCDAMIKALKRWRKYLGLTALPSPADNSVLIPKINSKGAVTDTTTVRNQIQLCFDGAAEKLKSEGFEEEAHALFEVTVHWLRHTGISEDVKFRPREHVRDDAGHGSSSITDLYVDIELVARHKSAKRKTIEC